MAPPENIRTNDLVLELIKKLQNGPTFPQKAFVDSKYSYSDVYAIAASLKALLSNLELKNNIIGLFTENKAIIAASIIAVMESDYILAMPYAFSQQAFAQMHQTMGLSAAIVDSPQILPPDVMPLRPELGNISEKYSASTAEIDLDKEIVSFYTGGSTGKPKGWAKSIRNMFSEAINLSLKYKIQPEDCFLATVPPYHIYGFLFSVLTPFISSSSVAAEISTYPHTIISEIQKQAATVLVSIPVHYRILNGYDIPRFKLRIAFSSAGILDKDDGIAFSRQSDVEVIEVYGSTETGGIAYRSRLKGEEAFTPFETIDWHIKNETLYIRSDYISKAVAMDSDSFYKIEDRVTLCGENSFQVLGRSDGIVKVGGKRVDLEGICEIIKKIPGVKDAVVLSFPATPGRENTIAALVAGKVDRRVVLQNLNGTIESQAMPRIVRTVDAIPVTATGKYDKTSIEQLLRADHDEIKSLI